MNFSGPITNKQINETKAKRELTIIKHNTRSRRQSIDSCIDTSVILYRCRRLHAADLQKEFADEDSKDQHGDQVDYRRLRCKGWCVDRQWWWGHAWWLLQAWGWWWRVQWRGTGNLAQSYTLVLHTFKHCTDQLRSVNWLQYVDALGLDQHADTMSAKQNMTAGFSL